MSHLNNNLLYRWFGAVRNRGREDAIDEMAASDVVATGLSMLKATRFEDEKASKAFWRQFRSAFPDVHVTVEDGLVGGDKVMVRCTVCGTHKSEGIGLAPTPKRVTFTGMCKPKPSGTTDASRIDMLI